MKRGGIKSPSFHVVRRTPDGDIIGCCLADGEELKVLEISADKEWARIESLSTLHDFD